MCETCGCSATQAGAKDSETIEILGQGFTGTTKVLFHGVPATFAVVSETYLTAVVPAGATTTISTATGSSPSTSCHRRERARRLC